MDFRLGLNFDNLSLRFDLGLWLVLSLRIVFEIGCEFVTGFVFFVLVWSFSLGLSLGSGWVGDLGVCFGFVFILIEFMLMFEF